MLVDQFVLGHEQPPEELVLDIDASDVPGRCRFVVVNDKRWEWIEKALDITRQHPCVRSLP